MAANIIIREWFFTKVTFVQIIYIQNKNMYVIWGDSFCLFYNYLKVFGKLQSKTLMKMSSMRKLCYYLIMKLIKLNAMHHCLFNLSSSFNQYPCRFHHVIMYSKNTQFDWDPVTFSGKQYSVLLCWEQQCHAGKMPSCLQNRAMWGCKILSW